MTHLLVIQHEPEAPAAWFGQWWGEAGTGLSVCRGDLGEPIPQRLERGRHHGLVVLGGAMGANDDADHPWLTATKRLIADTVHRGLPFLGICLGHQLAAVALGGSVAANPAGRTLGLYPVALTELGHQDPLLYCCDGAPALWFNDDIVTTPPEGAEVLAEAPDGTIQALRLGEAAWSVQFHPECSPEVFAGWGQEEPAGSPTRTAIAAVTPQAVAATDALVGVWRAFALRFAAMEAPADLPPTT
ncbi:MAG: type 1 glutamine amidotransferase [Tetrasphaera sp.]|nr:type 1 glutamine amidotransferase [Tetrasphaera sp.]